MQERLASVPVVDTIQQRLNALPLPAVPVGAAGPVAAGPDLIWSGALLLGALLGIWFMRWFMIPVFLIAGALALIYGVRPGVSLVTRSVLFVAAGAAGDLALSMAGSFGGAGVLSAIILMVLVGRGIWGLMKEGIAGAPMVGRRFTVLCVGLGICLLATFFQWEPVSSYANISLERVGTIYTDGSGRTVRDSTWLSPRVDWSFYGGDNGGQVVPWLLGAAALLLYFRNKQRPLWAEIALMVCLTFMLVSGVQGLGSYLGFGVILFFGGFSAVAWSLLSRRA